MTKRKIASQNRLAMTTFAMAIAMSGGAMTIAMIIYAIRDTGL
jgi:hypothetical protein